MLSVYRQRLARNFLPIVTQFAHVAHFQSNKKPGDTFLPMFINVGRGFDGAPDSYIYVHFPTASGPDTAYWGRLDSLFISLT